MDMSKRVINIGGGEPEFDTPPHIVEAMKRALDEGHTHYGSFAGIPELKEAVAAKYDGYGVDVDPGRVLITPGSTMGIYMALKGLTDPGDGILTADPCFFAYYSTFDFVGVKAVGFPRYEGEGWVVHPEDLAEALNPRTKGILICSPDNPTGAVLTDAEMRGIADLAVDHDLTVVADEIYDMITFDGAEHRSIASLPGMAERTVILNGFSKAYAMTGWRLGYVIAPSEELYRRLFGIQMSTYLVVNAAVQRAGVAALTRSQDCVREMVEAYDAKRRFCVDAYGGMDGVECASPQGAMYVFPDVSSFGLSSSELCGKLMEAGVSVRSGADFGSRGEGHFRQSYAQSMADIREGLERMAGAFEGL